MSQELRLRGDGGAVHLTVHGRERTSFEDVSDANWLNVSITVMVAGCSAGVASAMTSGEFVHLARELRAITIGEAKGAAFRTVEESLELDLSVGRTGSVLVTGKVQVFGSPSASLSFQFETDLSSIGKFAQDVLACASRYPVIE